MMYYSRINEHERLNLPMNILYNLISQDNEIIALRQFAKLLHRKSPKAQFMTFGSNVKMVFEICSQTIETEFSKTDTITQGIRVAG